MRNVTVVATLGILLHGCLLRGAPVTADGGSDTFTTEEGDAFDRGSQPMLLTQNLAVLADSFFDFDPTIDPNADAATNAAAIKARILDRLAAGVGVGCGTVALNGTTVTVDFGTGCELLSVLKVSGVVAAEVQKSGATITVAFTFTALQVNGHDLDGTASFATSTGTSFTVNAELTSGGVTLSATDLVVSGVQGSLVIDGVVRSTKAGVTTRLTFTGVTWKLADCYPNSGTLQVKMGLLVQTFVFDAETPQTGDVTVKIGKRSVQGHLPAYGSCPPA